ncbi:MAG: FAD/NAD(P)-binding protein [bacterium]
MKNIYMPHLMTIQEVIDETPDVKTFKLTFDDERFGESFTYEPGQFGEYSVIGVGEAPFTLASSPTRRGYIECSIKRLGKVTTAIHNLQRGDTIGFRGPYGNKFPYEDMRGKNLIFISGGIGAAALRSLFHYILDNRGDYKNIMFLHGARSPADLVYKSEIEELKRRDDIETVLTVDKGDGGWKGNVGFVPTILKEVHPSPENAVAITCGPPIMIKFVVQALSEMGFADEQIVTTLEMKMKCGLGKCGRCNIGSTYVCKEGPVFTYKEIKKFTSDEY